MRRLYTAPYFYVHNTRYSNKAISLENISSMKEKYGDRSGTRTPGQLVKSQLLYQLS